MTDRERAIESLQRAGYEEDSPELLRYGMRVYRDRKNKVDGRVASQVILYDGNDMVYMDLVVHESKVPALLDEKKGLTPEEVEALEGAIRTYRGLITLGHAHNPAKVEETIKVFQGLLDRMK